MENLKVDIRDIIVELGNEILLVKSYRNRFKEELKDNDAFYGAAEVDVEFNRYEAEIDMLNKIRNEYMKLFNVTEDDIKLYMENKVEADKVIEMRNINPINTTSEVESITYTIK